ncbi:MAG: hypothetical protein WA705_29405 [Candidatus Ozemobacteraceae bacterium]
MMCIRNNHAFSFVEVIVAFAVSVFFFGGLIYLASTTRMETSKAENYLRALQIAQETIELVQSTPVEDLTQSKMQIFEGSLVNPQTVKSILLPFHSASAWQPQTKTYPEQYTKAYFYRKIQIETVDSNIPNARFLRKVIVEVFWNESKVPNKIDSISATPDRMRKLSLATVVFDEREYY